MPLPEKINSPSKQRKYIISLVQEKKKDSEIVTKHLAKLRNLELELDQHDDKVIVFSNPYEVKRHKDQKEELQKKVRVAITNLAHIKHIESAITILTNKSNWQPTDIASLKLILDENDGLINYLERKNPAIIESWEYQEGGSITESMRSRWKPKTVEVVLETYLKQTK